MLEERAAKAEKAEAQAEERAAAKRHKSEARRKAERFDYSMLCRCGRPPANRVEDLTWCLLCTKPTGNMEDGVLAVAGAEDLTPEQWRGKEEDLTWSIESGSWQLVAQGPLDSEYTRAFRRKPHSHLSAPMHICICKEWGSGHGFTSLMIWADGLMTIQGTSSHCQKIRVPMPKRQRNVDWASLSCGSLCHACDI